MAAVFNMAQQLDHFDDDDDEFFGRQDDDINDHHCGVEAEWNGGFGESLSTRERLAKETELEKVAFVEAYDKYKDSTLQEGFELGLMETFDAAKKIGRLLGKVTTARLLAEQETNDESTTMDSTTTQSIVATAREYFANEFQKDGPENCSKSLESLEETIHSFHQHLVSETEGASTKKNCR